MPKLIFDIETIGEDFEQMDAVTQQVLTHWIKKESADEEEYQNALKDLKNGLGFSPLHGEIAVIGILDYEKNKGAVYYQAPGEAMEDFEENGFTFRAMTEKEMLVKFWEGARQYNQFITFNGRCFDAPFLIIRSAAHQIKPTINLMPHRYSNPTNHIDLLDQLTFYGAMRRRGSLHLWCRAFGIKSPKADGISGYDVGPLFKAKQFIDIAKYNVGDLLATKHLYQYWRDYVNFG